MKTFINLATLRRGGGMTHVNAFLPELLQLLPGTTTIFVPHELKPWAKQLSDDVITHKVPEGSVKLAITQQITARWYARHSEIVISVMNTGPIGLSNPQVIWACNVSHFVPNKTIIGKVQNWIILKAMNSCELCIFPTGSAREMAVASGFKNRSAVMHHPMRRSAAQWQRSSTSDILKIFVPASNNVHKNLSILPNVSLALSDRGVIHEFNITIDAPIVDNKLSTMPNINFIGRYKSEQLETLANEHDVAFIPSLLESYSYSLAELEQIGMPVAASNIQAHTEISGYARHFNPHSFLEAADSIIAAIGHTPRTVKPSKFISDPEEYASNVFSIMNELVHTTSP